MNLQDMFGLNGRIALVTGGSRGIGKMIVEGYLAAGASPISRRAIRARSSACPSIFRPSRAAARSLRNSKRARSASTFSSTMPARRGANPSRDSPKRAGTR
jgi:hypothetical protein